MNLFAAARDTSRRCGLLPNYFGHSLLLLLLLLARLMASIVLLSSVCHRLRRLLGSVTLHGGSVRLRPVRATPSY